MTESQLCSTLRLQWQRALRLCLSGVLLLPLLALTGCFSTNLYLATSYNESSASPTQVYVLSNGDLAIECQVEIGYRSITRELRYIVVSHDEMAQRIAAVKKPLGPKELPHIYLPTDTPCRYVTLADHKAGEAATDPALLTGAADPIPLHAENKEITDIVYEFGSLKAIIERKGLLREEADHSSRSAGGNLLFALGIVPAAALDVVTSPIQLVVAVVYYIKLDHQFNLQPVGL